MSEHSDKPGNGGNIAEYSVSELSAALKRTIETGFGRVRVRGEISSLRRPGSGHLYFDLKDEGAVLASVCWKGVVPRLAAPPEDGLEVLATGRLSAYGPQSKYQLIIESLKPTGEGALLKLLEERKRRLAAEGLFDSERKKSLPFLPGVIGVVTSPSGAVIRDILHRLSDRFPRRVVVWPANVQGEGAAAQIVDAIGGLNALTGDGKTPRPDLIIVARGGGSLEDLMAFNDEAVARAAAASEIPLISAIGHETDTTLIDHAADRRAPTPTAAAEMAVPVRGELQAQILDQGRRLTGAALRGLESRRLRLDSLGRGLPEPMRLFHSAVQWLDERSERLRNAAEANLAHAVAGLERAAAGLRPAALKEGVARRRQKTADLAHRMTTSLNTLAASAGHDLRAAADLLESYSYKNVLARGYAVVRDSGGRAVTRAGQTRAGMAVAIEFADAAPVPARIEDRTGGPGPETAKMSKTKSAPRRRAKPAKPGNDDQGRLL